MLKIGVSTVSPDDLDSTKLPPQSPLVPFNSDGFWSKSLDKEECQEGNTVCVYITEENTLVQETNGGNCKVLLYDVNPQQNLWLLFDIYGSVKTLEIITGRFLSYRTQPVRIFPHTKLAILAFYYNF